MIITKILQSLSAYPIPSVTLECIAESNGFSKYDDIDMLEVPSAELTRAKADTLKWLSDAPAVSQQGISYSFTETERKHFKDMANDLLNTIGEGKNEWGYKGDLL